jgi:hypothetical protein
MGEDGRGGEYLWKNLKHLLIIQERTKRCEYAF